ncbi:MAG TPA: serine hydrolase [Thermoanaerobaculia bacterium]|nr:serine hydrolase [Thermoanaerobaculia bacterium]
MSDPRPARHLRAPLPPAGRRHPAPRHLLCLSLAGTLALSAAPLLAAPATAAAPAVDAGTLHGQIEGFLAATYPADEPGAAAIAVRDGEVVYRGARGMADVELGVPLEPDMVFRLGSITKQFTAAAVLLLEEQGKLSIDDPITRFLPDYPTHGHTITIAHLLAHTSGIRSYTGIPGWMQGKIKQDLTLEELIDGFESEPMDFAPGERFLYNNSGYVLLGAIIEKASGRTYQEVIDEEIFRPLGMTASYYGDHGRIIPRRVKGYDGGPGNYRNAQYLSMSQPHAAGSLLSTVDDLAHWDATLHTDDLLGQESRKKQVTPFTLNDGSSTGYAYGLSIGELRGRPSISHGGGIFGFSTFALRLPEDRVYVAVLSNDTGRPVRPGYVAQKIAAMVIGDPFPEWEAVERPAAELEQYVGVYRIDEESTRIVKLVDGKLVTQRTGGPRSAIESGGGEVFFYPGSLTYLTFERGGDGEVTHMLLYQNGAKEPERAERTDDPVPSGPERVELDPAIYDRYVGVYELQPGFDLTVTRDGDRLITQATGQGPIEIFPTSETEFFAEAIDARLRFTVEGGRATSVILVQGGRELPAKRKD